MIEFVGKNGYRRPVTLTQRYSDNTPFIKLDDYSDIVDNANTIVIRDADIEALFNGLALCEGIKQNGGYISNLVLPYLPGARQDRVNPTGDVMATSAMVENMIGTAGFDIVLVADPHSRQSLGDMFAFPMADVYDRLWKGYDGVIAPDKGGRDRADLAGRVMGRKVIYGEKVRDVSTGRLSGFDVQVTPGAHYIVIDDICDGGGTFLGLGERIREQGAYADLFVTHGIFSKGTDELKKIYKNIYTTDSRVVHDRNDVMTIPIVERMIAYV